MEPPPIVALATAAYLYVLLISVCRGQGDSNYISDSKAAAAAAKKDGDNTEPEVDLLDVLTSPQPTVEELPPCPSEKPMRCKNGRCFGKRQRCNGKDNCGDGTDELYCGTRSFLGIGWPWYHWVLACAFGGAACILIVYGIYLVIARRQQMNAQERFRIDRESLDGGGTPVRFVNRDAQQTKYNAINQDTDGLR